jgi:hypothetical protein
MTSLIRCRVYPGQFSDEYAVSGEQAGGERFSLFVPVHYVTTDAPPTRDAAVEGWIHVAVWEQSGNNAVVLLPRQSFESGRFVTVRMDQFQAPAQNLEA